MFAELMVTPPWYQLMLTKDGTMTQERILLEERITQIQHLLVLVYFQDVRNVEVHCFTSHDNVLLKTSFVRSVLNEGITHLIACTYAEVVVVKEYLAMIRRTVWSKI